MSPMALLIRFINRNINRKTFLKIRKNQMRLITFIGLLNAFFLEITLIITK